MRPNKTRAVPKVPPLALGSRLSASRNQPFNPAVPVRSCLTDRGATDYTLLTSVDREIKDALHTFETERDKQSTVLKTMRQELRHTLDLEQTKSPYKPQTRTSPRPPVMCAAEKMALPGLQQENTALVSKLARTRDKAKALKKRLREETESNGQMRGAIESYVQEIKELKTKRESPHRDSELTQLRAELRAKDNELRDQNFANDTLRREVQSLRKLKDTDS